MTQNNYLDFKNPIQIIWRKGSADDPFVDRLDITKVVNQRVSLLEIPDELYRVRISNMQEINYERFIKNTLSPDDYYVDYSNGFIYFHHSKEAQTISVVYKGRGMLLYPTSRLLHYDGTNPAESLHDIIENVKFQVKHLIDETQNFEEVMKNMVIATNLTKEATDRASIATEKALTAVELVEDAYKTTVLIYQPFVQTEKDIATTYPNPFTGWTTMSYESGIRYRWNGAEWIPIDALGGNIPLATNDIDGLLSKEMFKKVNEVSDNVDIRGGIFFIPQEILSGVQEPHFVSPFKGEIESISASVSKSGSSDTSIRIEKSTDYLNWSSITPTPILIETHKHFDSKQHAVSNRNVEIGDVFRLYVPYSGDVQNLTLNLMIKIS